jgi:hypothetical protein
MHIRSIREFSLPLFGHFGFRHRIALFASAPGGSPPQRAFLPLLSKAQDSLAFIQPSHLATAPMLCFFLSEVFLHNIYHVAAARDTYTCGTAAATHTRQRTQS